MKSQNSTTVIQPQFYARARYAYTKQTLVSIVLAITTLTSRAAEPVGELAGEYLSIVTIVEALSSGECRTVTPLWIRNSSKAEQWIASLSTGKEKSEFLSLLPRIRAMNAEAATPFLKNNLAQYKQKYRTTESACAAAYSFLDGLIMRSEKELLTIEYGMRGTVTVVKERPK